MYQTPENPSEVSEAALQAAGHLSSHTYADMRSARRAYQRTCKYDQERLRTLGSKMPRNKARRTRRRDTQSNMRPDVWSDVFAAERETNQDYDHIDDVDYFEKFGRWRLAVQDADDFGAWGRRRIMEMRAVKEERMQRQSLSLAPTRVLGTTLPTTPSDIHHHALLAEVLTPNKFLLFASRWNKTPPFPIIDGFYWFGEFEWAWHRNASGCWEFGGQCGGGALPCPCCNMGNGSMAYPCSCEQFAGTVAPEDTQRCGLVEWASSSLMEVILEDIGESEEDERWVRGEWDMVSDAASEAWSLHSEQSVSFDDMET
jgi:hypothetical protein